MGDRRVSESPPEARLRSSRPSEKAGAPGPHRGLRSQEALAGAPIATGAPTPMHPGGAGRLPRSPEPAADFLATFHSMQRYYDQRWDLAGTSFTQDFRRAEECLKRFIKSRFEFFGEEFKNLASHQGHPTKAEQAYRSLQEKARRADNDGNCERASVIRESLVEIDRHAAADLQSLKMRYGPAPPSPTRAPLQMPATDAPRFDWCMAFQQLTSIRLYFQQAGQPGDAENFRKVISHLETQVRYRFKRVCGSGAKPPPRRRGLPSKPEQRYRTLEDSLHQAETTGGGKKAANLRRAMQDIDSSAIDELSLLARSYGPLEVLAARTTPLHHRALLSATPMVTAAVSSGPSRPETGASLPTSADLCSELSGPSSRIMSTRAPRTPTAPAPEVPLARREAIVERFRPDEAVFHAGFTIGNGGDEALSWAASRTQQVLNDLDRLHRSAGKDPKAAAALAHIDWSGIEALTCMMDVPPLSP